MARYSSTTKRKTKHAHFLPYPDFPLSPHVPTNRWYKVINGKRHYFGKLDEWQAAIDRYNAEKDYLRRGQKPPSNHDEATLRYVLNHFLTGKKRLVDNGELTKRTFYDYRRTCEALAAALGLDRQVADLGPSDFAALRQALAKKRKLVALTNQIIRVRTIFKSAYESGLVERQVSYGDSFSKPSQSSLRRERRGKPENAYAAGEVKQLIEAAGVHLRAMVYLGINCGFGPTDCAALPLSSIDWQASTITFPRPKTGARRRAVLWPETLASLRASLQERTSHCDEQHARLVFITKYGKPWVRESSTGSPVNGVGQQFGKLVKSCDLVQKGRGFYALRHTFRTIADQVNDQPAINLIMGHDDPSDMSNRYRQHIDDTRLTAIAERVHQWLFATP